MRYFNNIKDLNELKAAYRKLAMANHPDRGGDPEVMKEINSEYTVLFNNLKDGYNATRDCDKETTEAPEDFINIIEVLLKLEGISIELCGRWLWIGGNTYQHKDALRNAGCRWCSGKKLWSWHFEEDGCARKRRSTDMNTIRFKYGSQIITATSKPSHSHIGYSR